MSERREGEALAAFRRVAGLLGLVALPISLLLAIWADEVAQLAFQRQACGEDCVAQIAPPLVWYALGIWPAFLSLLLNRTLSAANLQRDILWTTVVTVALTIVLDVILLGPMEQAGLALAATLGVFANAAMLLARMRRRFPALPLRGLAERQARLLAAAGGRRGRRAAARPGAADDGPALAGGGAPARRQGRRRAGRRPRGGADPGGAGARRGAPARCGPSCGAGDGRGVASPRCRPPS